ncbi:Uncharacterized protein Adt_39648 [Abeliophyllum distichum]|uniref:CCHC-type domain-containing protein n=1 Tax=Abeliophyllum distichum TaxID=126358 RepID=A0ABD1Q5N7_9LAMI
MTETWENLIGENLLARGKNSNKTWNSIKKDYGKKKGKPKNKSKGKTKNKKCFYCQEEGHFIKYCPKRPADQKLRNKTEGGAALAYNENNLEEKVYVVTTR